MINFDNHQIVSKNEWITARKILLNKEKEFTALRDQISQQRGDLPWDAVDKEYFFDGPNGRETLSDLFDERSQLIPKGRDEDGYDFPMRWVRHHYEYGK